MVVEASVVLPNGKKAVEADASHAEALVPPILVNKTAVAAHTRLVAMNDLTLQKIDEGKERKRKEEKALHAAEVLKKQRTA